MYVCVLSALCVSVCVERSVCVCASVCVIICVSEGRERSGHAILGKLAVFDLNIDSSIIAGV